MNKYVLRKIKKIKFKDLLDCILLLLLIVPSIVLKIINKNKRIWLICEDEFGANDNGFVFFNYVVNNHPQIKPYYIINSKSNYYEKVLKVGKVINWGSIKHWLYYLTAEKLISTQLGASPNIHVIFPLEIAGILKNKRVFLQHGITLNYYPSLQFENNKLSLFICGAKPEYDFVRDRFNYPNSNVKYTGFARFDLLHDTKVKNGLIIVMPTWRSWIVDAWQGNKDNFDFKQTEYYQVYNSFLTNSKVIELLKENELKMIFYLHRGMQDFVNFFESKSPDIIVAKRFDYDIQELLRTAALMITDYSSVSMDFGYMCKPIIYYQFDENQFRKQHGKEGYFSYRDNGFGPVCEKENDMIKELVRLINRDFRIEDTYKKRIASFYEINDTGNCERIYKQVDEL